MFNAANFPGASTADITQAKNLYAMLTGRITSIHGDARINEAGDTYVPLGKSARRGPDARVRLLRRRHAGAPRRTLTVSAGLRYVLAEAVLPDEQQLHDRRRRPGSTASRARQPVQARNDDRHRRPR